MPRIREMSVFGDVHDHTSSIYWPVSSLALPTNAITTIVKVPVLRNNDEDTRILFSYISTLTFPTTFVP